MRVDLNIRTHSLLDLYSSVKGSGIGNGLRDHCAFFFGLMTHILCTECLMQRIKSATDDKGEDIAAAAVSTTKWINRVLGCRHQAAVWDQALPCRHSYGRLRPAGIHATPATTPLAHG